MKYLKIEIAILNLVSKLGSNLNYGHGMDKKHLSLALLEEEKK